MILEYILSSFWIYLLALVPIMMFVGKNREYIIIYNRSRREVEKILEYHLKYNDIPFLKEDDDNNTDVYNYLLLDTNEKIKLKVGLS
ncbi:hypothetical protein [Salipaludibacillus daqingensis]|uniref:hypothetical protein n=1 Tax=Salipaludibacillus daqingensis TaxID=3041001 RepID=UPI002473F2A3|nr:hypothetical protein [Salipaludibacillus daqingensis]